MSHGSFFTNGTRRTALFLPFDLEVMIGDWEFAQRRMARSVADGFSRDEWAYLTAFVSSSNLRSPFGTFLGEPADSGPVHNIVRPRGQVGVWLPNNVSLLGPLMLVLMSLTGNQTTFKAGTRSNNLVAAFMTWLDDNLRPGPLAEWLTTSSIVDDASHGQGARHLAETAAVRIVFGSNEAIGAINEWPQRPDALTFGFGDLKSEAWLFGGQIPDDTVRTLIRVFAIFGQAGCTSPRHVRLIDGDDAQVTRLSDQLVALWPNVVPARQPMHTASENVGAAQIARALGWSTQLVPDNAAVIATGEDAWPRPWASQLLTLSCCPLDGALADADPRRQTVGYWAPTPRYLPDLGRIAEATLRRFVPLAQMHHFGSVWDGFDFWSSTFEVVEVAQ